MKQFLFLFFSVISLGSSAQFPYSLSVLNEPYQELDEPISLSNGEIWDDPNYMIPLGFNFQIIDQVTSAMVLDFPGGQLFPALVQSSYNSLTPFGDDIIDAAADQKVGISPISYFIEGNAGSRIVKIEWQNVGFYDEFAEFGTTNNRLSFQVWLYEGSNIIEYRYGPNSIKNEDTAYTFGGPMVGMTKNFNIGEGTWENLWFLGGGPQNPTVSNYMDNMNPPDASILLNATLPEGLVYRFVPTFVSVPEMNLSQTLKVYPTRSSDNIQVDWQGQNSNLVIRDISGRNVISQQVINGVQKIEISHLAAGTYLLSVNSDNGIQTIKFIKE